MPRPSLLRHMRIATALARHLGGRSRLRERMRATTPLRFLRRLTLVPADRGDGVEQYSWPPLDDQVEYAVGEVQEAGEESALGERPINVVERVANVEVGDLVDALEIADTDHIV